MSTVWANAQEQRDLLDVLPDGLRRWTRSATAQMAAATVVVLGLTVMASVIGASSSLVDRPAVYVPLRVASSLGLVALAVVFARRGRSGRMAALLLATAAVFSLAGLTAEDSRWPFAVGRIAASASILLVMWVCFAYPTGRIAHRPSLRVLQISSAVFAALLAANLLLARYPPVAGPFVRCSGHQCPSNPLALVAVANGSARWLSTGLGLATVGALIGCAAALAARVSGATTLQRHSLIPMATWGALSALAFALFVGLRAVEPRAHALDPFAVVVAAIIALLPLAIGSGLVRGRVLAMSALEHMILELREHSDLANLQQTMAAVFEDPDLRLLAWQEEQHIYLDSAGDPIEVSSIPGDRVITEFKRNGRIMGAAVHDPMLSNDVVRAAGSVVGLALDNDRLQGDLRRSVQDLESSRQRVMSAADRERRRIEQDLHDGAQQGLIALRIKLHLLKEVAGSDPQSVTAGLADAGARVDSALEQIRNLAQGVYPTILRDLGLSHALASVVRELPVEAGLHTDLKRRLDPDMETAVYFCCVEALQNAVKHAGPEAHIELWISETRGRMHFAVADSGSGFEQSAPRPDRGLSGMADRIAAVGGRLAIKSAPGEGTLISGAIPLPAR